MDTNTPPLTKDNKTRLYEMLVESELFVVYRKAFEKVTGHNLSLIREDVSNTPKEELTRCNNDYCSFMIHSGACSNRCTAHIMKLAETSSTHASTHACEGNITTTLIPVKVNNEVICYLHTGQILLESQKETHDLIGQYKGVLPESVTEDLVNAFEALPVQNEKSYYNQLVLLGAFSLQLAGIASEHNGKGTQQNTLVERSKIYIKKQLTEKICLDELASHNQVTPPYLCRQFKKQTGLTIVEYINRHRIELAKKLLRNDGKKIIDIAYACGFQSLSQFNRSFQRYTHSSPREYRNGLVA